MSKKQVKKAKKGASPKPGRNYLREWLISLAITLVMFGLVIAAQAWYTSVTHIGLNNSTVWIGNAIGACVMLVIVHHFVKPPKDRDE